MSGPPLRPVIPGLDLLEAEFDGRFPFSHSFVVRGETNLLIDAGCGHDRLRELGKSWRPDLIVVSHSHPDHCSGAWLFPDAEILSPRERSDCFWRFTPQSVRFAGRNHAAPWRDFVTETMGIREFAATGHFEGGDVLDTGRITLECHHAPGHTDDHYVLFEPHHGIALTFDIDLTSFGPWYGHVESDIDHFLRSIELVSELQPRVVLSSHKGVITDEIGGRLAAFAAIVGDRDRRILALLDRPRTVAELTSASPIYGGRAYAPAVFDYWEGQMICKHLRRLEQQDLIEAVEQPGRGRPGPEPPVESSAESSGTGAGECGLHETIRWIRR
jgi:glyoxylase-like metal-dependent hydrolase (beta-lactamase superfamily II)